MIVTVFSVFPTQDGWKMSASDPYLIMIVSLLLRLNCLLKCLTILWWCKLCLWIRYTVEPKNCVTCLETWFLSRSIFHAAVCVFLYFFVCFSFFGLTHTWNNDRARGTSASDNPSPIALLLQVIPLEIVWAKMKRNENQIDKASCNHMKKSLLLENQGEFAHLFLGMMVVRMDENEVWGWDWIFSIR